jgi:hypothetical protein
MALGLLAAVAAGATACAQEADPADVVVGDVEYEATSEFLAAAAERSQGLPHRMEMRTSSAGATRSSSRRVSRMVSASRSVKTWAPSSASSFPPPPTST